MSNVTLKVVAGTVAAIAFAVAGPASAVSAHNNNNNGSNNPGNKVTICHATGSATNPFVVITPNVNGIVHGHYDHQDGRDIIPSFDYKDHGVTKHFAGQNLANGGQAILDNGCVVPNQNGGGQGGGGNNGGSNQGGQVLSANTVAANATGSVDAGYGGANAFTLTSLDRVW
jgi:hypothetical protein